MKSIRNMRNNNKLKKDIDFLLLQKYLKKTVY